MTGLIKFPALIGTSAFDDLFADFFRDPFPIMRRSTEGYPVTDIFIDDDGNHVIKMALAGFSKDNIKIEVKENTITIKCDAETTDEAIQHRRIATRAFSKTFIDYDNKLNLLKTDVTFKDGLLSLIIPKLPEEKPKLLDIK